jgi:hypothetical protein
LLDRQQAKYRPQDFSYGRLLKYTQSRIRAYKPAVTLMIIKTKNAIIWLSNGSENIHFCHFSGSRAGKNGLRINFSYSHSMVPVVSKRPHMVDTR